MAQLPLLRNDRKFVYFKKGFQLEEFQVKENEIGILQSQNDSLFMIQIVRIDKQVQLPKTEFEYFDVTQVGDAFPKKVCNVCQRYLDTDQFELNQNAKGNRPVRRPSCRDCRIIINGKSVNSAEKKKWERTRPNLVPFKCPICEKTTIPGLTSKVVLDHDHDTGRVRGWICDSCNTGIGRFKDDIDLLKKAIHYLENR